MCYLPYIFKVCGLYYAGSTVGRFRQSWKYYKCSQRIVSGGTSKQNYLRQNFPSENHHGLLEDCEISLIDKTNLSDPTRGEFFLM